MSATTLTMLLAGAANLLPALFFMFTALLGSNGMNSTQGGKLLGALAVLLVPVYLWLLHRDAMLAPQRAAELAKIEALLAETETRAA